MKRNYLNFIYCFFVVVAVNSCSENLDAVTEVGEVEIDYSISIETAISSLDDFLMDQGVIKTKGGVDDYIQDYFAVSGNNETKSSVKTNSLYAVNFKDNKGYALLSADRRIPEDIIAVVEYGNVSEDAFYASSPILIPDKDDDMSVDEYKAMVESGALARMDIENRVNLTCLEYADKQIAMYEYMAPFDTTTYHWEVSREVPRLLETAWTQDGQDELFNKYCPMVGIRKNYRAPAGCVCIAVAQIIAFHEYPPLKCNGILIDYDAIKEIYSYNDVWNIGNEDSREMLARFVADIGRLCKTKYFRIFGNSYGFAWPKDAAECFRWLEYDQVELSIDRKECPLEDVISSLDRKCPVFMAAIDNLLSGHAWVVDGYIIRDLYTGSGYKTTCHQELLHCNWGWHGQCNGYFTAGIFKPQKVVIDDGLIGRTGEITDNYHRYYRTITYHIPNR